MKTDPFDDAIRRKLEGVDPPFQEKNWTQFQRFMGVQGFPPSLWQTPTRWLQPALMAAAVAGVMITTVWQYRTTQSLNEHVQTLTKTVERLEQSQMRLQKSVSAMNTASARVDTVYLTRSTQSDAFAARPSETSSAPYEVYRSYNSRQRVADAPLAATNETGGPASMSVSDKFSGPARADSRVRSQRTPVTDQLAASQPTRNTQRTLTGQPQSASDQLETGPATTVSNPLMTGRSAYKTNPVATDQSRYRSAPIGSIPIPPESGRTVTRRTGRAGLLETNGQPVDYQSNQSVDRLTKTNEPTLYSPSVTNQAGTAETAQANPSIMASGPLATVHPLVPMAPAGPSEALAESWQRHLRRVRYRSPYMTSLSSSVAAAEPASPQKHTTPLPVEFRVGVGGELGTAQTGLGVYAEAIVANHWTVGTGLSQINWAGDAYQNEQLFMNKTKRDFRKDYPGTAKIPIGPGRPPEVTDISRAGQSLAIPLQLGYRIGLRSSFVLTPFVGLNLSLNPRETVTYAYEHYGPRDEIRENLTVKRPQLWYSSWTTGVGVERQWNRLTAQVSPVILMPLTDVDACLNSASFGVRGRLFYRF
ncbi:hypothetical protein [Fibrella forsythiae]|uniref:Outer membrane protein beta-barrel domain-containing protein n=1 Tax=Fibrella forsythiae TaxID=2817061 RepID=A0ABS3JFH9_9BACT|nr:hypothetical protein [Fibrella forsythiae]MBO0948750.1 hypothetical protein [Fibrella forsythiae]